MSDLVTDDDIARARTDLVFRQQLLAENLERLLARLNTMRKNDTSGPDSARQIKEGVALAVKLADKLQKNSQNPDVVAAKAG
ncbi:MAG: hypothetical protein GC182_09675 [Rhodopseudomonas sp.]|nr:hypothetical protein [Rhodopseudomonas sp.]